MHKFIIHIFACLALSTSSIANTDESEKNLKYWKELITGNDSLSPPEGVPQELWGRVKTFNEYEGKQILAAARSGDYTHAGGEAAIEVFMKYFSKNPNRTILDVACGLGGTADYIQKHGWGKVTGFDIETESINYARLTYPDINFYRADVMDAAETFKNQNFDLICIVNAFVCFHEQERVLKILRELTHENTQLMIFDYTDISPKGKNPLVAEGKVHAFLPIRPDNISEILEKNGWTQTHIEILDDTFENWYAKFLHTIEEKRSEIEEKFGIGAAEYAKGKYSIIYHRFKQKQLGGCVVIAKPKKEI